MKKLAQSRVAIVGLGLMGGSLGGALRGKCREVVGIARRAESVDRALAGAMIDRGVLKLEEGVHAADIVVLATPVRVVLDQLEEVGPIVQPDCLVIDLGSTKREVVARMAEMPEGVQPLGGHPMCGKEVAGIEAAEDTLYEGCTFVLTPLPRTSDEALALGRELAEAVGGKALILEAGRHDRLVAAVSHLPYVLACALVGVAAQSADADSAVWQVAASGYRDTSRLAASDVTMMLDILLTNREEVLNAISGCQAQLAELASQLAAGDEQGLRAVLGRLREERASWRREGPVDSGQQ